jgi:hypothetical protein
VAPSLLLRSAFEVGAAAYGSARLLRADQVREPVFVAPRDVFHDQLLRSWRFLA